MKCVTQLFRIIIVDIGDSQDGFFSLFKKISILGVTNDRRLSLVFWAALEEWNHKENKQMWKMVVTTQKMEQVKGTRGSAPFRATFYYVWTAGKRTKAASW